MEQQTIPQGYKQTEVGVIPEDWVTTQLGKRANFIGSGKTNTKDSGSYPLYGSTGLIGTCSHPEYEGEAILIARVGANAGKLNFVTGQYGVSDNTIIVKLKSGSIIHYFKYWLIRKNLNTLVFGSGQPLVTGSQIKSIVLPIPSKQEQTAIATALSDVDSLIASLNTLIAKKQAIKTATMQQLLTGKTRLPAFSHHPDGQLKGTKQSELGEIPVDWGVLPLEKLVGFRNGAAHENCIDESGDFIVVNSKFISTEGNVAKASNECRSPAYKNDILMVMSDVPNGRAIAKCYLIEKDDAYTVNQRICAIKSELIHFKFLFYILNRNPYYLAFDDGSKQTNLRRQDVLNCPLPIPSATEQIAIANILTDMDTEIQTLQQRLNKTKQLRQGIMQELLTGRTRLI